MKKIFLAAILISAMAFGKAQAQISFSLNIGVQPDWGPVGYDHAEYYYMPDIGVYYDVPHHQYVYPDGRSWVRTTSLPPRYSNFDLYNSYKVVINQPTPYMHDNVYRTKYAQYRGHRGQTVIRDSRDAKYRNHYHDDNGNHKDNGRGNGWGHDKDHGNNGRGNDQGNDHGRGNDHGHGNGHGNN